jgi:hypothetical protein
MRVLGMLTTLVLLAGAATVAVVGVRSIPDIQRYLKIRQM